MSPIRRIMVIYKGITVNRTDVHCDKQHHSGLKQNLSSFSTHTAPPNKHKTVLECTNFRDLVAKEAEIRLALRLWLHCVIVCMCSCVQCCSNPFRVMQLHVMQVCAEVSIF
jgi:hypothetical protein